MDLYVYSRQALEAARPHEVPHAIISITSAPDDLARLRTHETCRGVLRLAFADAEEPSGAVTEADLFSAEQAADVWAFVLDHHADVERFVVHCDAGVSRSPAVAAALARVLKGDDTEFFSGKYRPNKRVYRLLLEAAPRLSFPVIAREHRKGGEAVFEGCLLGLAIGDALGFPAEFRRREQIVASFGADGLAGFVAVHDPRWPARPAIMGRAHPPGTYSDDTQMTIAVAEALLARGASALDPLMDAFAERFVAWSSAPDNDRAPGNACMAGCHALARGVPWREAGVADSKGCGSAMRVAPIGLRYWRDRARLLEVARAQALLTHRHDAGIEGAAAAALLVAEALEGSTPREMYDAVMQECAPRSADLAACFRKLPGLLDAPPEVALSSAGLGEGWVAEEAVASALWCFWRSPADFSRVVLTAANTDGDSDSIACIAGGIAGAHNGIAGIPREWTLQVENAERLRELARRLFMASG